LPQQDLNSERGLDLIRVGTVGIGEGDEQVLDDYFNEDEYVFHGPDGEMDYQGLKAFFASMRSALDGYACERHDLIVKGDMIAARTQMSGRFTAPFNSPKFGRIEPNGQTVKLEIINFFRYDDKGKLVEEWVQYDNLVWHKQLGLELIPGDGSNAGSAAK
jgi:predicted ester cyclase